MTLQAGPSAIADHAADLTGATDSEMRDVRISTSSPDISVRLSRQASRASTDQPDEDARDLVNQAVNVVHQWKSRRSYFAWQPFAALLGFALFVLLLMWTGNEEEGAEQITFPELPTMDPWGSVLLLVVLAMSVVFMIGSNSNRVILVPMNRQDAREKRRSLVTGLLLVIVGGLFGVAGTLLATQLSR